MKRNLNNGIPTILDYILSLQVLQLCILHLCLSLYLL